MNIVKLLVNNNPLINHYGQTFFEWLMFVGVNKQHNIYKKIAYSIQYQKQLIQSSIKNSLYNPVSKIAYIILYQNSLYNHVSKIAYTIMCQKQLMQPCIKITYIVLYPKQLLQPCIKNSLYSICVLKMSLFLLFFYQIFELIQSCIQNSLYNRYQKQLI